MLGFSIGNGASPLRYAGVTYLLVLVHVSSVWSCKGETLINVAIGPSSEARATELRSLRSEDRGVVVSFHLTNFNSVARPATEDSLSSVQLRQPFWALSSQEYGCFLTEASPSTLL